MDDINRYLKKAAEDTIARHTKKKKPTPSTTEKIILSEAVEAALKDLNEAKDRTFRPLWNRIKVTKVRAK